MKYERSLYTYHVHPFKLTIISDCYHYVVLISIQQLQVKKSKKLCAQCVLQNWRKMNL